jgi:hypothetical protein
MYLVHVMTRHNCTLDIGLVSRYKAVARTQLSASFVPTPCLKLVVFVSVLCVIVIVPKYVLVTFHTRRACTLQIIVSP